VLSITRLDARVLNPLLFPARSFSHVMGNEHTTVARYKHHLLYGFHHGQLARSRRSPDPCPSSRPRGRFRFSSAYTKYALYSVFIHGYGRWGPASKPLGPKRDKRLHYFLDFIVWKTYLLLRLLN
jgi:hypothetical protein